MVKSVVKHIFDRHFLFSVPPEIRTVKGLSAVFAFVRCEHRLRSQRGSNLVLHVHETHLNLSAPENLLSGALFSAASTSSKGGCGQTCGRMETLPWNAADSPLPGSVWIVALFHRKVKSLESLSAHSFCVAVDKEIRRADLTSAWVFFCQRDNYSRQNEK